MLETIYAQFLPKGQHPFAYLSLEIQPEHIDVNVHPTKREVHFLHEEKIVAMLGEAVHRCLSAAGTSRQFSVPVLKPFNSVDLPATRPSTASSSASSSNPITNNENAPQKMVENRENQRTTTAENVKKTAEPRYEYKLVRTDSQSTTLDQFVKRVSETEGCSTLTDAGKRQNQPTVKGAASEASTTANAAQPVRQAERPWIDVRLSSILELRKQVKKEAHGGI